MQDLLHDCRRMMRFSRLYVAVLAFFAAAHRLRDDGKPSTATPCLDAERRRPEVVGAPCAGMIRNHTGIPFRWRFTVGGSPQCCCQRCAANNTSSACLPHANLVGFPKAGSTALHGALLLHPSLSEGYSKELALHWEALEPGGSPVARRRLLANLLRPTRRGTPVSGASNMMINSDPTAHEGNRLRLLSLLVPNARILFMLRDPAERALSALLHQHRSSTWRHQRPGQVTQSSNLYPTDLLASVERLLNATAAAAGALCLATGVSVKEGLPALLSAALLPEPTRLPACLSSLVVSCHDPRAERGDRAMALWPLHAVPPPKGMVFYLAPILEAYKCFGPRQVDVRWLEDFRADPAAHIRNVTRFLGLQPLDNLPRSETELSEAMQKSNGSVAALVRTAWASPSSSRLHNDSVSREQQSRDTTAAMTRLRQFFMPFERAYCTWAAHSNRDCVSSNLPLLHLTRID